MSRKPAEYKEGQEVWVRGTVASDEAFGKRIMVTVPDEDGCVDVFVDLKDLRRAAERKAAPMKVIDNGHRYELAELDGDSPIQLLQFVKREGKGYPGNVGSYPGTTSQEVLRTLINRAVYVNGQIPCWQTRLSIYLMGAVIWLYEHRAAQRHGRPAPGFYAATYGDACGHCGHVGCERKPPR